MPVSMLGRGRAARVPSAFWSYCMKTRFQISKNRSPFSMLASPKAGPRSTRISEQGPHGPTSPMLQKLSFSPSPTMRSGFTPATFCHSSRASASSL
jgi:hypothetical protein